MVSASLASYVQDKLYNELFSRANRFLQENANKFDLGWSLHKVGNIKLEEIRVKHVKVEDMPGCRIKFYVFLELEVYTFEGDYHYDDYEDQNPWLLFTCEGDIDDELENITFLDVEDYTTKPKQFQPMDDALVPIISRAKLDTEAENFLRKYYPKALLDRKHHTGISLLSCTAPRCSQGCRIICRLLWGGQPPLDMAISSL